MAEQSEGQERSHFTRRLRSRRNESVASSHGSSLSASRRTGLLTPEQSTLTESQATEPDHGDAQMPQPNDGGPSIAKPFPFMELPAELRILVYYMALHRDEPILLHAQRATPEKSEEDDVPDIVNEARSQATMRSGRTRELPHYMPLLPRPAFAPPAPEDAIVPAILRLNQQTYKEARQVLYGDNVFTLRLSSGVHTLSTLHQRSRSLIKHVILTIPSHHDILDGFADLVRLGLRYLWGLKTFKIILQASLPDDGRIPSGATSVYANAFHILRWLPKGCRVILEGNVSEVVRQVVTEEGRLQSVLDDTGYQKRQHQMPERH
ncbi:hypothetical protein P153DRAFT_289284 [Dothidotthia symphoricarpi CBS 119687]|uniref:Uncharacterized protein n=1 Tax=Dothidotthia symphoricarpi CBS 119687 TaxID=1392245 RepID=A0A6A6AES2_9PLEO|nr:uncharacterized protein P153DRAFT_289284 [Dothidotthia symphoricarpi CBS 119687]KAF2130462.1 hypothetical protein P153DRAFT_289284 [Dothidotthia symphoricarpi CBS 119687]